VRCGLFGDPFEPFRDFIRRVSTHTTATVAQQELLQGVRFGGVVVRAWGGTDPNYELEKWIDFAGTPAMDEYFQRVGPNRSTPRRWVLEDDEGAVTCLLAWPALERFERLVTEGAVLLVEGVIWDVDPDLVLVNRMRRLE
jgi:hypothetical protein